MKTKTIKFFLDFYGVPKLSTLFISLKGVYKMHSYVILIIPVKFHQNSGSWEVDHVKLLMDRQTDIQTCGQTNIWQKQTQRLP